jgi:mannitol-1-/sugar-/sorbitol-6-phosphatase
VRIAVDAILFDLDGVLVDSRAAVERHWSEFADTHGLDSAEVLKGVHGRRTVDNLSAFASHLDPVPAARELEELETEDTDGVNALPGAARVLSGLPADTWAVVTSGSSAVASARIRAAGLPVPAVLITADDVDRGKPEPDGYLAAARAVGVPPGRCLVVEDTPAGLAAGRAAGALTLGLLTTHGAAEMEARVLAPDLAACLLCLGACSSRVTLDVDAVARLSSSTNGAGWALGQVEPRRALSASRWSSSTVMSRALKTESDNGKT